MFIKFRNFSVYFIKQRHSPTSSLRIIKIGKLTWMDSYNLIHKSQPNFSSCAPRNFIHSKQDQWTNKNQPTKPLLSPPSFCSGPRIFLLYLFKLLWFGQRLSNLYSFLSSKTLTFFENKDQVLCRMSLELGWFDISFNGNRSDGVFSIQ